MRKDAVRRWRIVRTLVTIGALVVLVGAGFSLRGRAQGSPGRPSNQRQPTRVVMKAVHHDVSPPLRDLPSISSLAVDTDVHEPLPLPALRGMARDNMAPVTDGALQTSQPRPLVFADVLQDFDGIPINGGDAGRVAPPDTNGAAGLTQYVQLVNLAYAVYNKADGTLLAGPTRTNSLWAGFGGDCEIETTETQLCSTTG
jgi:hypothetical protein